MSGSATAPRCPHGTLGWNLKVLGGLALIVCAAARFLLDQAPALRFPVPAAQLLVLTGGAVFFVHYLLLKRLRTPLDQPPSLITHGGLFPLVRHPMYLGDALMDLGLALLAGSWLSVALLGLCLWALRRQAIVEDRHLAERFPEEHRQWRSRSGLLVPRWRFAQ